MEDLFGKFMSAWNSVWTGPSPELCEPVTVPSTASYPLARTVEMPDEHPFPCGALSFRMMDLELRGVSRLDAARSSLREEGGRLSIRLTLPDVTLRGQCSIDVKPDPVVRIDHGGDLMELSPDQCRPIAAGANGTPPLDPQKEEWLDNAREQRTRLAKTENGQKLLGVYSEHNEVYDQLFKESEAMQTTWQKGGVTKQMAADTSDAVKSGATINDKQYTPTDGSGQVSYNGHAFTQQLAVLTNTLMLDPDFDPFSQQSPPAPKYMEAARAAQSFRLAVHTTGNTKDSTSAMTSTHVYDTVDKATGEPPKVSDAELLTVVASNPAAGGGPAMLGSDVLDEEDRGKVRNFVAMALRERAEKSSVRGAPLFGGTCTAKIGEVGIAIEIAAGSVQRPSSVAVDLPAFELNIDDSTWTGQAGRMASGRVERMLFIRSLLCDSISARLQEVVGAAAEAAYRKSLS